MKLFLFHSEFLWKLYKGDEELREINLCINFEILGKRRAVFDWKPYQLKTV